MRRLKIVVPITLVLAIGGGLGYRAWRQHRRLEEEYFQRVAEAARQKALEKAQLEKAIEAIERDRWPAHGPRFHWNDEERAQLRREARLRQEASAKRRVRALRDAKQKPAPPM